MRRVRLQSVFKTWQWRSAPSCGRHGHCIQLPAMAQTSPELPALPPAKQTSASMLQCLTTMSSSRFALITLHIFPTHRTSPTPCVAVFKLESAVLSRRSTQRSICDLDRPGQAAERYNLALVLPSALKLQVVSRLHMHCLWSRGTALPARDRSRA